MAFSDNIFRYQRLILSFRIPDPPPRTFHCADTSYRRFQFFLMLAVKKLSVGLCAFAFSLCGANVLAQAPQPAQKPQTKPRADAKKVATAPSTKAQPAAKTDRIMTIDELRTCMTMQKANEVEAAAVKQEQADFTRDQDTIRAEQAEIKKVNDDIVARSNALRADRESMANRVTELRAMAEAAKTDAEKADYEREREKLAERSRAHDRATAEFNSTQQSQAARIDALNARIGPLNERGKTVNDRVEPLQEKLASWRVQCSNRRYREDDEIAIKKELAARK
jgi:chromosome segregation ATPase